MAKLTRVNVLEHCKVSPPQNSAPSGAFVTPLTFFDIPWLFFPPSQPLFFYEYHFPTSHFLSKTLPTLKHSLSLALQYLLPFAGNLVFPSQTEKPNLVFTEGDFVSLTIAESDGDFGHLTANHQRDVDEFHSLVPELPSGLLSVGEVDVLPSLALQFTIFPNRGVCIGLAYHHVVADGRTFNNFIKTWASFCKDPSFALKGTIPMSFDRSVILDQHGLEEIFLNEWFKRKEKLSSIANLSGMGRATFVVSLNDMERIERWIVAQCKKKNQSQPVHLSAYVLTCSFVWVCLVKAFTQECKSEKCFSEDPCSYFGFNAGGITRLGFRVPTSYFGNCIAFGRSMATRSELVGEDGIIVAANAIGNKIRSLDKAMLGGAEKWISDWEVLFGSDFHVLVSGSPKVDLYKTDFGWGRPNKIEDISIDKMRAISLMESRDFEGGIEVGLTLPSQRMEIFTSLFHQGLKQLLQ